MQSKKPYTYDSAFMRATTLANRSAESVIKVLGGGRRVTSVADFGCAVGVWLAAWQRFGVTDILGVDGSYVDESQLQISPERFVKHDLARPIDLGRRFDLVQSVEVAEHLPEAAAYEFVGTLVRHADLVLFSAAPPGQGGEYHINERPYDYWRELFGRYDYQLLDWVRPRIAAQREIQYWYRYNLFLFVNGAGIDELPPEFAASAVPASQSIADLSPWSYRLRKQVVRRLPSRWQTDMSRTLSRLRMIGRR